MQAKNRSNLREGEPLYRSFTGIGFQVFRSEWPSLVRVQATEVLVARADELAWELGLRGYDAVHLVSALLWQEGMGERVTVATFDQQLWETVEQCGMIPFPDDLPAMLDAWPK
ncbi:MAG: hypothetical protein MAG451_00020 [Anaerolineales bacterium]|nr:hypothetical protein [Anaerolineales bacterium]